MSQKKPDPLSSRALLQRIGLSTDAYAANLDIDDDLLDSPLDGLAQALQERFRSLNAHEVFKPGDLVCWKPGLRNRRFPRYDRPAVVLEVLDVPVLDSESDSGLTYFRDPLDLVLGLFLDEGEHRGNFLTWHFDSRRFKHWQQGAL